MLRQSNAKKIQKQHKPAKQHHTKPLKSLQQSKGKNNQHSILTTQTASISTFSTNLTSPHSSTTTTDTNDNDNIITNITKRPNLTTNDITQQLPSLLSHSIQSSTTSSPSTHSPTFLQSISTPNTIDFATNSTPTFKHSSHFNTNRIQSTTKRSNTSTGRGTNHNQVNSTSFSLPTPFQSSIPSPSSLPPLSMTMSQLDSTSSQSHTESSSHNSSISSPHLHHQHSTLNPTPQSVHKSIQLNKRSILSQTRSRFTTTSRKKRHKTLNLTSHPHQQNNSHQVINTPHFQSIISSQIPFTTPSASFTTTTHSKSKQNNILNSSTIPTNSIYTNSIRQLHGTWKPAPGTPGYEEPDEHLEVLNKFCTELTKEAKDGRLDPMIGRLDIMSRCVEVLSRRRKNNPILTGEPGTGKTAIIEGLAQAIVSGQVPDQLRGKKIYSLDMAQLVAGATYRGEFEERLTKLIKALESKSDAILFVDEVHLLIGAGKTEGAMDAANMLKPVLARGKIRFMGATTTKEYTQHIEKDGALARRFETIHVPEPTVEDCMTILRGLKPKYEQHHKVLYRDSAIIAAAQMAKRYFTDRRLPDKAIDLLDEAGAHVNLVSNAKPKILAAMEQDFFRLNMELESLKGDNDPHVIQRRYRLEKRIDKLKIKVAKKESEWKFTSQLRDRARDLEQQFELCNTRATAILQQQRLVKSAEAEKMSKELYNLTNRSAELKALSEDAKAKYNAHIEEKLKAGDDESLSTDVTYDVIAKVVAQHTGVPVSKLLVKDKEKLLNLEDELRKRVVAQDHALTAVSTCVRVARAGLHNGQRPQGVFLFCGPSGVGKTELCKALAENLFGSSDAMVRLDMSEYSEAHTVSRLIGAAPGYIGYEEGGQLTEAVRKRPYQVVLLDEIEKAHKQVHTVLLQIMEEANLTDGKGNKVDFSNTIFIMTSNLGAHEAAQYRALNPQLDSKQLQNDIMTRAVKQYFPPEFVNRLDDLIFFNSLQREHMNPIVRIQLEKVGGLLEDHHASLVTSPMAINELGNRGFQPEYGARPVKRAIYRNVTQVLAEGILAGVVENHSLVTMRMHDEPEYVPEDYVLESTHGIELNDKIKSCDPAFKYAVYKKKVLESQKKDRFFWESDDEDDDITPPSSTPSSRYTNSDQINDDDDDSSMVMVDNDNDDGDSDGDTPIASRNIPLPGTTRAARPTRGAKQTRGPSLNPARLFSTKIQHKMKQNGQNMMMKQFHQIMNDNDRNDDLTIVQALGSGVGAVRGVNQTLRNTINFSIHDKNNMIKF